MRIIKTRQPGMKIVGLVYFLGAGPFVKIGWSERKHDKRLEVMQTGCPYEMTFLGFRTGSVDVERELHQMFAAERVRGEWFILSDRLKRFIVKRCIGRKVFCEAETADPSKIPTFYAGEDENICEINGMLCFGR